MSPSLTDLFGARAHYKHALHHSDGPRIPRGEAPIVGAFTARGELLGLPVFAAADWCTHPGQRERIGRYALRPPSRESDFIPALGQTISATVHHFCERKRCVPGTRHARTGPLPFIRSRSTAHLGDVEDTVSPE